jgi:hypothetical protein
MMTLDSNAVAVCPVCQGELVVSELRCGRCDLTIQAQFARGKFDGLSADQMSFLLAFLRCRGVIRDMEAQLGISYPTVRSRLDSLLATLGLDGADQAVASAAERRRVILQQIDTGELTPDEGLRMLEALP